MSQQPLYPQVQPSTAHVYLSQPVQQQQQQQQPQHSHVNSSIYVPKSGSPGQYVPQQVLPTQQKKGLFSSVTKSLETGIASVSHEIDKGLAKVATSDKSADERFRKAFMLPPFEGLMFELPCKACTFDNVLIGHLYLSYSYLSFYAEYSVGKVVMMIPLRDIIFIQKTMIGKSSKEKTPNIVAYNPVENKLTEQYVLEVYTNLGQVHQFFSLSNFEQTFFTVETSWRNCNKSAQPPQPLPPPQQIPPPQQVPQTYNQQPVTTTYLIYPPQPTTTTTTTYVVRK